MRTIRHSSLFDYRDTQLLAAGWRLIDPCPSPVAGGLSCLLV